MSSSKEKSGGLGFFGWFGLIGLVVIAGGLIACKSCSSCLLCRIGSPAPDTLADEKTALQNLRNLTDAQDHYFHRNEKMAASITQLEWGGDFDAVGCIIWRDLWNARGEERSQLKGPYCYYTLPVVSSEGELDPFSFCVAAVPVNTAHPLLIGIVGPVKNSLAFKKPWPFKRIWRKDAIKAWSEQIATQKPIPQAQYESINPKQADFFNYTGYTDESVKSRTIDN